MIHGTLMAFMASKWWQCELRCEFRSAQQHNLLRLDASENNLGDQSMATLLQVLQNPGDAAIWVAGCWLMLGIYPDPEWSRLQRCDLPSQPENLQESGDRAHLWEMFRSCVICDYLCVHSTALRHFFGRNMTLKVRASRKACTHPTGCVSSACLFQCGGMVVNSKKRQGIVNLWQNPLAHWTF